MNIYIGTRYLIYIINVFLNVSFIMNVTFKIVKQEQQLQLVLVRLGLIFVFLLYIGI